MLNIEKCSVCDYNTEIIYTLKFNSIYGLAEKYVQKIRICPNCGFIFTGNPFDEELLNNRYKNLSKYEYDSNSSLLESNDSYKKRCMRQYVFINNIIGINNIDSVFEVGASSGFNLSLYFNEGLKVYGVEPSQTNVVSAKKCYDIDIFNGVFQEYLTDYQGEKIYDLIFLSHTLEHIINPYQFLLELSKINSKYMFIEVPCLDYKFSDEPFGMFTDEHINYFTFDNLRYMMKNLGYSFIEANMIFGLDTDSPSGHPCLSTIWIKNSLIEQISLTIEKLPINSSYKLLNDYINNSRNLQNKINTIIDSIDNNIKIGVWGTGNHTSKLLGMSNLGKKNIVKFYDSDTRKKNEIYYGREITPFCIDDIIKGDVELILISTYTAQVAIEAVIEKIMSEFNININYITLY
jgi:hypothetical protein